MAITGHSSLGKIMWQTSYSETLICIVAYYFGINSWWCVDSRPIYRQQHYRNAANLLGRRFLGIDREEEYLILSKNRKKEIEQIAKFSLYHKKIKDISLLNNAERMSVHEKEVSIYDLPF